MSRKNKLARAVAQKVAEGWAERQACRDLRNRILQAKRRGLMSRIESAKDLLDALGAGYQSERVFGVTMVKIYGTLYRGKSIELAFRPNGVLDRHPRRAKTSAQPVPLFDYEKQAPSL